MPPLKQVVSMQIGKQGLTAGVKAALARLLTHHKQVRISVLKSAGRSRESMESLAKEIISSIPSPTRCRIIGFTIIINRKKL